MNPLPQNGLISSADAMENRVEQGIDAALARKPEPSISNDFASKVMARAAALPPRRSVSSSRIGRNIAWASAVMLAVALFVIAPQAAPNLTSIRFDIEMILLVQLACLGWWLSRGYGKSWVG
jgi:hypothetical protein